MNNPLHKISDGIQNFFIGRAKNTKIFNEYYKRSTRSADWNRQPILYNAKQIRDWTNAITAATDPENPRHGELMRFYQSLMLDLHLMSCLENRILPTQCAPFKLVDKSGNEDEEAKKLLERPWYLDLVKLVNMASYQGTTLIEMIELNEKGELKEVTEIPKSNFLPDKGIVIKDEWDTKGISYKEGLYKDFYIQIGSNWDLGLFSIIASIVLAKKLGLGSWMSFIEKFGVPPIFAITERMDTARRDELFDMLQNFRMNHFAVLQGNEKIEVPNNYSIDAYNSFDALMRRCDEYLSKYILGGTGLSDQKAFVGSVEAQERLLKFRHQVDKLMFKFYFNEEIKPRLVKLSSVYKPLENLAFEYDETETLTLKEILDAIKGLSPYYNFNIEELAKITGLPVTGIRSVFGLTEPEPADPQKKKSELNARIGNPPFASVDLSKIDNSSLIYAATWDTAVEQLANDIWNGNAKPEDLDRNLVLKYYNALNKSAQNGWGKGYYDNDLTRKFRENLLKASGAKSYNLIQQIEELKRQSENKEAYIENAKRLINLHNDIWQQVENKFATNSASSARDFESYQKDVDIYPNLKNRTMMDENVRDTHAVNEGIIKPVNEWTEIPPFDPGCRCWLEQTTEEPTGTSLKNINPNWANNPAVSGKIFNNNNNYFTNIPKGSTVEVNRNTERMKEYMPYNRTIKHGDNTIHVNDFHDRSDYEDNISRARILADELNKDIFIRPHFEGVAQKKSPEYGIGRQNILGDLKVMPKNEVGNFFSNGIHKAHKQDCKFAIMDISNFKGDATTLSNSLKEAVIFDRKEKNRNVTRVIIIRNGKIIQLSRKQIIGEQTNDLSLLNAKEQ